jgi:hypothetical protein
LVKNDVPEGPLPSKGHGNFIRNTAKFLQVFSSMMAPAEVEDIENDDQTRGERWGHLCERLALARSGNEKFFVTEKGFIGTRPAELLPDNVVCVLFGGRVPFVLRRMMEDVAHR